jgi:hypothetical protein
MIGATSATATGSFAGGVGAADNGHGVINQADLAVTQNDTPNMTVNVAAGGAFIRGTQSANQGVYHLFNDASVSVVIATADATNARHDLIIAQVRDAAYSGATNDARIIVVPGTPAAVPVDPSLASFPNALVLARVTVTAGKTSILTADITNTRTVANQVGKIPTYNTSALATTAIPSPVDGQAYYLNLNTDQEGVYFFNGSNFRRPWNMPWGRVGSFTGATNLTYNAAADTAISCTASIVANRNYRFSFSSRLVNTSGSSNNAALYLKRDGANVVYFDTPIIAGSAHYPLTTVGFFTSTTTTSSTFLINVAFVALSGIQFNGATQPNFLTIEDIGPSGAPA